MKNKIIIGTVLAIATAVLLTGCIVVNVEKTAPAPATCSTMRMQSMSMATNNLPVTNSAPAAAAQ